MSARLEVPGPIHFTSELLVERRVQLEELLFFNANQAPYREAVVESIRRFGEPMLREDRGRLRVHTARLGAVQSLYAMETRLGAERPVGVAVYARTEPETMSVLHVGVHPDFAVTGAHAGSLVTVRLVQEVAGAAGRIKDIRRVEIPYGRAEAVTIAIPHRR